MGRPDESAGNVSGPPPPSVGAASSTSLLVHVTPARHPRVTPRPGHHEGHHGCNAGCFCMTSDDSLRTLAGFFGNRGKHRDIVLNNTPHKDTREGGGTHQKTSSYKEH
ncbi:unnamed protein product [Lampetra fluviatilis]